MAGRGPVPKPHHRRARRNASTVATTGQLELSETYPNRRRVTSRLDAGEGDTWPGGTLPTPICSRHLV